MEGDWEGMGGKGERMGKGRGGVPLLCLPVPLQLAVAGDATDKTAHRATSVVSL